MIQSWRGCYKRLIGCLATSYPYPSHSTTGDLLNGERDREVRAHFTCGYLFETTHNHRCSPLRIQQIMKETAAEAGITKRVHPHPLRHSVAQTLLNRGMPLEQIQKFLGYANLETTQIYAESSTESIEESYRKALGG